MIKIKEIKPMFTALVTTADKYTQEEVGHNKLITNLRETAGTLKDVQKVLAVGTSVRDIKVGDLVCINPKRYAEKKYEEDSVKKDILGQKITGYHIPEIVMNDKTCLYLDQVDIEYIITDYEEIKPEPDSGIIHPNKQIIIP